MSETTPTCFICHPNAPRERETPWQWSSPRALCREHARDIALDDGLSVPAALARLHTPEGPVEGSLLSWIFNPAFVIDAEGHRHRCWIDTTAGGVVAFEDAFEAAHYHEFWAFTAAPAVDLLWVWRQTLDAGAVITRQLDLLRAMRDRGIATTWPQLDSRGPWQGWERVASAWRFGEALARWRSANAVTWPRSRQELFACLDACPRAGQLSQDEEQRFCRVLDTLARRRFPDTQGET